MSNRYSLALFIVPSNEASHCMFRYNEVELNFIFGGTTFSYIFNYGIAPWFKSYLFKVCNKLFTFFYFVIDESLNSTIKKCQIDVAVRFWNDKKYQAETRYCNLQYCARPNASNLKEATLESVKYLDEVNFLQLNTNGPM